MNGEQQPDAFIAELEPTSPAGVAEIIFFERTETYLKAIEKGIVAQADMQDTMIRLVGKTARLMGIAAKILGRELYEEDQDTALDMVVSAVYTNERMLDAKLRPHIGADLDPTTQVYEEAPEFRTRIIKQIPRFHGDAPAETLGLATQSVVLNNARAWLRALNQ